jgi:hypothetical protein
MDKNNSKFLDSKSIHINQIDLKNNLEILLYFFPEEEFDWEKLSYDMEISWSTREKFINKPWNFKALSTKFLNNKAPWEIIEKFPDKDWDWNFLSRHISSLKPEQFIKFANKPFNWYHVSIFTDDIWKYIIYLPDKDWDWDYICRRKYVDWNFIKNNLDLHYKWSVLSNNEFISIDIIRSIPNNYWDWDYLSSHKNINFDIITNNPDLPWNMDSLSRNKNIDWKIILNNLHLKWNPKFFNYSNLIKTEENPENKNIHRILFIDNRFYKDIIKMIMNYL